MADLEQIIEGLSSLDTASLDELVCYINYLKWKQASCPAEDARRVWSYDFVEHFGQAIVSADRHPAGMDVQVGEAACGGDLLMALWQHPPVQGSASVEYQVPIPPDVRNLQLRFATGIRDGAQLASGNIVAFRLFVNDWKIWSDTQHAQIWIERDVLMPSLQGDVARIQFVTDGLGNHEWAWSVWGEPKLVGRVETPAGNDAK